MTDFSFLINIQIKVITYYGDNYGHYSYRLSFDDKRFVFDYDIPLQVHNIYTNGVVSKFPIFEYLL